MDIARRNSVLVTHGSWRVKERHNIWTIFVPHTFSQKIEFCYRWRGGGCEKRAPPPTTPPPHLAHHTFKLTIVLSSRFCLHGNNYLKPGYSRLIYVQCQTKITKNYTCNKEGKKLSWRHVPLFELSISSLGINHIMIPTTWFLPKINTDPIHTKSLHTF